MIDEDKARTARANDPAWQAEQAQKREAASAKFIARRAEVGFPIIPKKAGERF